MYLAKTLEEANEIDPVKIFEMNREIKEWKR